MIQGFTGISFPFRIGSKGGVVTSTTSNIDISHIVESMEQIIRTRPLERCMEYHIKSEVDLQIFEPNDQSTLTLIEYEVERALSKLEDRIEVQQVTSYSKEHEVFVDITFKVLKYDTVHTDSIKVGEIKNVQKS